MSPPVLTFSQLKRTVSIETVLNAEGLTASLKRCGQRLVGPCPVHGGDNPQAFVVDLARDLWYCFTRCQGGGDVVELVRRMHRVGYRQCAYYLAALAQVPAPPSNPVTAPPKKPFQPYTRSLRLDPLTPLLQQKGIRPETAHRFDAGGYEGPGFLQGCIAVRLHDPQARPLGYAGRRLDPQQARRYGKWKFPPGLPKRELLYGFHHIGSQLSQGLVVVESPWDVMRLMQIGFPTVALLGIQLSGTQLQLLYHASRIVLMLDGDDAGRSASRKIANTLTQHTGIRVHRIELPKVSTPTISAIPISRTGFIPALADYPAPGNQRHLPGWVSPESPFLRPQPILLSNSSFCRILQSPLSGCGLDTAEWILPGLPFFLFNRLQLPAGGVPFRLPIGARSERNAYRGFSCQGSCNGSCQWARNVTGGFA